MRRKDREMGREFGLEVIDKSKFGIISMLDQDKEPYGLPLSIVRDEENLYFHSAMDGRKVIIFEKNPHVSIAFVGQVVVPENYTKEELDEIAKDESGAGLLLSHVFTTEFQSAIVKGKVVLIEDREEKIRAMKLICEKYTPSKMDYFDLAIHAGLNSTHVYKIGIEEITAKRKRYNSKGEEMKWASQA